MTELEQARLALDKARNAYREAQKKEADRRRPAMLRNVGKCFKCRSCYSCPEKESDYWWMYGRVRSTDGYNYEMVTAAKDSRGDITIAVTTVSADEKTCGVTAEWQEIEDEEYLDAVDVLLREARRQLTRRQLKGGD